MWWVEKLESANKLILFQNNRPVRNEHDVLIFIVAVSALQEDETGRNITVGKYYSIIFTSPINRSNPCHKATEWIGPIYAQGYGTDLWG